MTQPESLAIDIIVLQHTTLKRIARELLDGHPDFMTTGTIMRLAETLALVETIIAEARERLDAAQAKAENN
jgi:hypothetical protein